ncbi:type IV pilus modification protein PilV [Crenothrix sp.]|uniref:type IV pilus modification protein PilV n=1 Tax=Crenothrix sp. TaxID=3100433 RepID=UPI00374DC0B9
MNNNTGFTLIEVLIAMMILAVGLLGLAALQASSLRNNQSAYYRSQATQLAYDIADRMRVNVASAATYTVADSANVHDSCLAIEGCTPAEMAEHDLYEWNTAIQSILPSGTGTITGATVAGVSTYKVDINWDDNRDDAVDDNDPSFSMSFRL